MCVCRTYMHVYIHIVFLLVLYRLLPVVVHVGLCVDAVGLRLSQHISKHQRIRGAPSLPLSPMDPWQGFHRGSNFIGNPTSEDCILYR